MSRASEARILLGGLVGLGRQQWLLRGGVAVLAAAAFGVEVAAGAPVQTLPIVLLAVVVLLSAGFPDSHAPLAVVVVLGGYWAMNVDQQLSVLLLVEAVLLLAFHVTCLLAAYGPPSVVLDAELLRRWLTRCGAGIAVALGVWVAARIAAGLELPGGGWAVAAGLLLLVGWVAVLARRLAVESD